MTYVNHSNTSDDPHFGPKRKVGALGKLEARHNPKALTMGELFVGALPTVPLWINNAVPGPAPMFCNDKLGCCTISTIGHMIRVFTYLTTGTALTVPDSVIENTYSALGGSGDSGLVEADVLNYWLKTGIASPTQNFHDQLLGFAPVKLKSLAEINVALYFFGAVYTGIALPISAQAQYEQGQGWSVVDANLQGDSAPGSWGGHAVPIIRRNGRIGHYGIYTWGGYQWMTNSFVQAYLDEAYAVISPAFLGKNGETPEGFNKTQLLADLAYVKQ